LPENLLTQKILHVDKFNKLIINLGPLGKYAKQAHGYYTFPKLEGKIGPRMMFQGKKD